MPQPDHNQPPDPRGEQVQFRLTSEILERLPDGFAALDCDWKYIYINAAAERILGRSRADLLGKTIWNEFPNVIGSNVEKALRHAMDQRAAAHAEAFFPGIGWLEEHVYPSEEGVWIFLQNITDRKRQQRELEETTAALEKAARVANTRTEIAEELSRERDETARWLNFLAEAEYALAASLDDRAISDTLVHIAVPDLADAAGIMEIGKDGQIHPVSIALADRSREEEAFAFLERHRLDPELPFGLPRVIRTGEPELIPEFDDDILRRLASSPEHLQGLRDLGIHSGLVVPLIARRRIIAALWFASSTPGRAYDANDLARARDLASRAALAIDNALLYKDVQRAERNSRFLAEAGAVLASSLDFEASLQNLARISIPILADYCIIDIAEDGAFRRVATAHYDPNLDELLRSTKRFPPDPQKPLPGEVIRSGQARLIPMVDTELKRKFAENEEHLAIIEKLNPGSYMVVPLTARGHTFGTITFAGVEGRRQFDEDDLALAEDLAHRAALMIDNARLYREAVEANRAKSDFLAVISHELRTPLNAIMGYTGLLEAGVAGPLNPDQAEQLRRIDVSARHLLELIEEVLTYSRMEMGREDIRVRPTDLTSLLREAAGRNEPLARAKGLEFRLDIPHEKIIIETDSAKLRQITTNLLSNAVKFTDHGQVTLRARLSDTDLQIDVSDTGIGITPEQQSKLFEPFWQLERGTTRRVSGTGLGLSVSQRLAKLLGGEIFVQSTPGVGSTFTLRLPRQQTHRGRDQTPSAA